MPPATVISSIATSPTRCDTPPSRDRSRPSPVMPPVYFIDAQLLFCRLRVASAATSIGPEIVTVLQPLQMRDVTAPSTKTGCEKAWEWPQVCSLPLLRCTPSGMVSLLLPSKLISAPFVTQILRTSTSPSTTQRLWLPIVSTWSGPLSDGRVVRGPSVEMRMSMRPVPPRMSASPDSSIALRRACVSCTGPRFTSAPSFWPSASVAPSPWMTYFLLCVIRRSAAVAARMFRSNVPPSSTRIGTFGSPRSSASVFVGRRMPFLTTISCLSSFAPRSTVAPLSIVSVEEPPICPPVSA